ncbi:MAG TPA: TlpA disulfide reductase family protein [Steroidobacteraceae bacterium]
MNGHTAKIFRGTLLACIFASSLSLAGDGSGPAPDFNLGARGGKNVALSGLRGQVVMINFWATWCGPCRQEMPLLEQMYKKYKPMGFTLLGVNVEPDPSGAEGWLAETPVSFPILFDRENRVSKLYNVSGMPSSVLIDRKGNVRYLHRGYKPGDENTYLNHIRALVKE